MAISSKLTSPFAVFSPNVPKLLDFTIPHTDKWTLYSISRDSNNGECRQWCEKGKSLADSEHISCTSQIIPLTTFSTYIQSITKRLNLLSRGNMEILSKFREDGFFAKWVRKSDSRTTYLFTLVLKQLPCFFILEYETTNINEYNSDSSIYLKMLRNAKIIEYPLFPKPNS